MDGGPDSLLAKVDNKVGLLALGGLVGVVDAGEALDLALAGGGVDAALVGLLADLERGGDVDEEEGAELLDDLARGVAAGLEGRDRGGDDGGAGLGQLRGHEADAVDVLLAVFAGEAELRGQLGADGVAEEERDAAAALLVEGDVQGACDGVLAGVGVAGKEDGETLLVAGRVGLAEDADDLGVGEPLGDLGAGAQTLAELGAGDVELAGGLGDLVDGLVLVGVGEVGHHLEGNDLDAELLAVLLDGVLGVVGAVEVLALAVAAGTGVVAADNEVGGTVVLADDGVPDGLAGTTHAHGERKQTEDGHAVGVAVHDGLVDTDASEVVNVTGLGQADDGVDEDVGLSGAGGNDGELTVSAVHGVAGLESDNLGPAKLLEVKTELGRGVAESDVVVVHEALDGLDLATDVDVAGGVVEVLDGRVGLVTVGVEDELGLGLLVGPVDILDGQDTDVAVVAVVTESDTGAGLEAHALDLVLGKVKVDGHGEEVAVGETVVLADAEPGQRGLLVPCSCSCPCNQPIVVLLVHETLQRGEATVDDELKIAKLALVQDDSGESLGLGGEFVTTRSIAGNKILQDTTWGLYVSGLAKWLSGCRRRQCIPWGGLAMLGNFCYV